MALEERNCGFRKRRACGMRNSPRAFRGDSRTHVWGFQAKNGRLGRSGGRTVGAGSSKRGTALSNWRPILRITWKDKPAHATVEEKICQNLPQPPPFSRVKPVRIDALCSIHGKPSQAVFFWVSASLACQTTNIARRQRSCDSFRRTGYTRRHYN